jgi:hypothetical protein
MSVRTIIRRFGGIKPMSKSLQHRHHTTVQGWWERNVIPARQQAAVLEAAQAAGIDIKPSDLIPGLSDTVERVAV